MTTFIKRLLIIIILYAANLLSIQAQPGGLNSWFHGNLQGEISDNWRYNANFQQRFYDVPVQNSRLSLINGSLEYRLKNTNTFVGGGYMFLLLEPYNSLGEKFSLPEHRLFQQITFNNVVSPRYSIAHRFRLEERFLFNERFLFRARYLFNSFWKLDRAENSVWGLIFRHEIRMNLEREQPFDSYRISALLAKKVSQTVSVEPGVIVQFNGFPDPTDYYLACTIRKSLSRRIKTYKPD
ncbi:DUF2490 domain-containing protein [Sphingobacterium sp. lm-10]|uniref:DUF2490 domain-containing protein n=1 Tax=Sphingobacterium sp. lm-10 TaxID=2944904 RepID=UPI00202167DF|nr:DUF2490 domain-containing protein [Sphingobacterium sp. lm-10]MCL7987253.1 DUF2490 domain-containing protein [Sphingobacterium sp. lm-10]